MFNLSPTEFLLWCYLADNKDGYRLDLYPVDFINKTGLSRSTYDRAFSGLVEKGYLLHGTQKPHLYVFREISQLAKRPDVIQSVDEDDITELIKELSLIDRDDTSN